jgi:hypothetical protein
MQLKLWERACPRWLTVSQYIGLLNHRYRGQARSHISPRPQFDPHMKGYLRLASTFAATSSVNQAFHTCG